MTSRESWLKYGSPFQLVVTLTSFQITIPADQRRDDERTYHKMKIKDLGNKCDAIDWVSYFRYAFKHINRDITEEEEIVVYSPDYLTNLSALIKQQTSDERGKMYHLQLAC